MTTLKQTMATATETLSFADMNQSLKAITRYAWVAAGVCFVSYLYFVGAITFSVIKQESLAQNIKVLVSQMSKDELQYLQLQKRLTQQQAHSSGFVSPSMISYTVPASSFAWNSNVAE